jgi:hypothetical protein
MTKSKLLLKSKADLMKIAKRLGLRGISTMNKPELAEEIADARQDLAAKTAKPRAKAVAKTKSPLKRRARRKTGTSTKLAAAARPKRKRATTAKAAPAKKVATTTKPSTQATSKSPSTKRTATKPEAPKGTAPAPSKAESLGDLPAAYGTGKLFLTARDPHWLYAYWDLSPDQMAAYAKQSANGKIMLRLFQQGNKDAIREFPVNHGTRDSYISVNNAGATYKVCLQIQRKNGSPQTISQSGPATTPPETVATSTPPQFVSIPVDIPYTELMELARSYSREGENLSETLHRLEAEGFNLPFQVSLPVGPWTDQQTNELEQILTGEFMTRRQVGSAEVSEWVSRRRQPGSAVFSAFRPLGASMFSPAGASWGKQRGKGFWFAVNAELIIYGATEPDATVTIDGKPIQLRPDGTFSFHYTFPDGHYKLPVVAISRDGDDRRAAELTFDRRTEEQGAVGKVAHPEHLKSPAHAP